MTALDPAQVAAEIGRIGECSVIGFSEWCSTHDAPANDDACDARNAATEVIRAAMEQAWEDGWMVGCADGDPEANPYAVKP